MYFFDLICLVLGSHFAIKFDSGMPEKKPVVGLSWQPQLPIPSLSKAANDSSDTKSQTEVSSRALWKPNSELVDGLFVPPNDPRKLNKLLRQQAKDTAGRSWYAVDYDLMLVIISKCSRLAMFLFLIKYTFFLHELKLVKNLLNSF